MGEPCHILGVLKAIRERIGKGSGDAVHIVLLEDTEPREVQVPEDFQKLLEEHPEAEGLFARLSYTHQKEYVLWIEEAKREETRKARMAKAINLLRQGRKEG